jgi:hypothetical protein
VNIGGAFGPMHPAVVMPMNCAKKMVDANWKLYPPLRRLEGY